MEVSVVVPTVGRPNLAPTLTALARMPRPGLEIVVVDDRPGRPPPLDLPQRLGVPVRVLAGRAAGPAAARNLGWRTARSRWVVFLDDDVLPGPEWLDQLVADLTVPARVGGVQGRIRVPLPAGRRPTDWERNTAGLARAQWITADMAYRRAALVATSGFDERFPRAFREDAELAYRVRRAGWDLVRGERQVTHPVRPERWWISLRAQRGNADDALLRRWYGRHWRTRLSVPVGRRSRHVVVTVAGGAALLAGVTAGSTAKCSRWCRRLTTTVAATAAAAWAAGTVEFARARIEPGPGTPAEVVTMVVTSALIPPLATMHWLRGWWTGRGTHHLAISAD